MPDIPLTWLGHATFRFDTPGGKRVYVDPFLENPKCPDNEREPEPSPKRLKAIRLDMYRWESGRYDDYDKFIESWRKEL